MPHLQAKHLHIFTITNREERGTGFLCITWLGDSCPATGKAPCFRTGQAFADLRLNKQSDDVEHVTPARSPPSAFASKWIRSCPVGHIAPIPQGSLFGVEELDLAGFHRISNRPRHGFSLSFRQLEPLAQRTI